MFTINTTMDLFDFEQFVGFWSGALDRWNSYTQEEKEYLNECIVGAEFDSLTAVNDFIWFEADDLLEELRGDEEEEEDEEDEEDD